MSPDVISLLPSVSKFGQVIITDLTSICEMKCELLLAILTVGVFLQLLPLAAAGVTAPAFLPWARFERSCLLRKQKFPITLRKSLDSGRGGAYHDLARLEESEDAH